GPLVRHARVAEEVAYHASIARSLPHQQRAAYVLSNLSEEAKAHFADLDRRIRALPHGTRQFLMNTTSALMRHAMAVAPPDRDVPACWDQSEPVPLPRNPEACGCAAGSKS